MTLRLDTRADHVADTTAVVDDTDETTVSYDELQNRAATTAGRLAALGVDSGDAVVVTSRNRIELLELFFAAERVGAVLAPVSYRLPESDVRKLVERIDPTLVLTEERFGGLVESTKRDGYETQTVAEFAAVEPARTTPVGQNAIDAENPLLYLHTGGTTGTPKVVVVTRRQTEWNCITQASAWGLGNEDVSPVLLPLFHTGGWHLLTLPTLYVGGTVVLQREFEPGATLGLLDAHNATHAFGVAAIFEAMAGHVAFDDADLSSVEWLMSGGGPTPESVMEPYRERGLAFTQGYGLTEGGPSNLYLDVRRPDAAAKSDTVGRPFPDCEARVVDDDGERVPSGEIGELEIRGPVAAREYLTTEDGTFGTGNGPREDGEWVSTGDLATVDADGDYRITGRVDNMFVSGGENVHPESVEDTLEDHPEIAAVGVVGVDHERWGTVPKAVVVPERDGDDAVDRNDLKAFARENLADYECPNTYEFVDALPESGAGKLDRAALAEQFGGDTR